MFNGRVPEETFSLLNTSANPEIRRESETDGLVLPKQDR